VYAGFRNYSNHYFSWVSTAYTVEQAEKSPKAGVMNLRIDISENVKVVNQL